MKSSAVAIAFCLFLLAFARPSFATLPDRAPLFRLNDHADRSQSLHRLDTASGVVLIAHDGRDGGLEQDLAILSGLRESLAEKGMVVWLINANPAETRRDLAAYVKAMELPYPILKDEAQTVSRALGLRHSGETLLIEPVADWKIAARYESVSGLSQVLGVLATNAAYTPRAKGGRQDISYQAGNTVTYSRDVGPILLKRCVICHTEGGIAPFAMNSHRKVQGWAEMIKEVLLKKQMPPWHADPAYQSYHNDLSLRTEEERVLIAWLDAGAPKGEAERDILAEEAKPQTAGWALGTPDHVVRLPEPINLIADGIIDYQYVYVPSGLTEDKWVRALEVRPTNLPSVHHALIFVIYPPAYEHIQPSSNRGLSGYFASYLPGAKVYPFPEGTAQFLPAGSTFVFQMHYTTIGKPAVDQTELGLYFHDGVPKEALVVNAISEEHLIIPAGIMDQEVRKARKMNRSFQLWGMSPHMHFRGSRFQIAAVWPEDGGRDILLNVPWYQFNWQPMYLLDTPITIPSGTVMECIGGYDNSKYNAKNPNPDIPVNFGEQSNNEMFIGYLMTSRPIEPADYTPREVAAERLIPVTQETISDSLWTEGGFRIHFRPDGTLLSTAFGGKWRMEGNKVIVKTGGREVVGWVVNDSIYIDGVRLRRVRDNDEPRTRAESGRN